MSCPKSLNLGRQSVILERKQKGNPLNNPDETLFALVPAIRPSLRETKNMALKYIPLLPEMQRELRAVFSAGGSE